MIVPPNYSLVSVSDYLSCPFKGSQLFLCVASGTKVRYKYVIPSGGLG